MTTARPSAQNRTRQLFILLAIIGVVVLAFAVYTYVSAQNELAGIAEAARVMNTQLAALDAAQQTALNAGQMALVQRKRQADEQRTTSIILGGVGLILIGAGWLGADLVRRRAS